MWKDSSGLPMSAKWNLAVERLVHGLESMKANKPIFSLLVAWTYARNAYVINMR